MVLSMERWSGKVAIVTGATSGMGAAIADALVEHGLIVAGIDLNESRVDVIKKRAEELAAAGKRGKLYGCKADLAKENEILDAFKWVKDNLGPVHILINCAGYSKEGTLTETSSDEWRKTIDVNLMAICINTREAIKVMRENNIDGHIININSVYGHFHPNAVMYNVYSGSKCAVTAVTETLRQELVALGSQIRVTSLSPGCTISEMTLLSKNISEERMKFFQNRPILKAEDIADGVVYVLSTPQHVQVQELTIRPTCDVLK